MSDGVKPFGSEKGDGVGDGLPAALADVGHLRAADADAFHPFQVFGDAFLGDIAAGPVPPDARLGRVGRVFETLFEGVARVLGGGRAGQDR